MPSSCGMARAAQRTATASTIESGVAPRPAIADLVGVEVFVDDSTAFGNGHDDERPIDGDNVIARDGMSVHNGVWDGDRRRRLLPSRHCALRRR